jgi:hypothetical protein
VATRKVSRIIEAYTAKGEDGRLHEIHVWLDIEEQTSSEGKTQRTEVGRTHKMAANGNEVNVTSDGTLVEVATGRKLSRIT